MAKTKKITVSLHRKLSDGDYGSYGAEVSVEIELEPGDEVKDVKKAALKSLRKDLEAALDVTKEFEGPTKKKK